MRAVSDPIREGAEGFLKVQYGAIFKIAIVLAGIILLSYSLRPANKESTGVGAVSPLLMGILASLSFGVGAGCSAFAGYISMWVSASTNIRVTSAARRSYGECLEICFRGGAFSAVLCITLCVFGVSMLYFTLSVCFVNSGILKPAGKHMHPSVYANSRLECRCACSDGWLRIRGFLCGSVHAAGRRNIHQGS